MGVRVVLLGKLADLAGGGELQLTGPLDWAGLLACPKRWPKRQTIRATRLR